MIVMRIWVLVRVGVDDEFDFGGWWVVVVGVGGDDVTTVCQ